MARYHIDPDTMQELIEQNYAGEASSPYEELEIVFVEHYRFIRHISEHGWTGPAHPNLLLEEFLVEVGGEFTLVPDEYEIEETPNNDYSEIDALEEEAKFEHSVNTRLNNFGD